MVVFKGILLNFSEQLFKDSWMTSSVFGKKIVYRKFGNFTGKHRKQNYTSNDVSRRKNY